MENKKSLKHFETTKQWDHVPPLARTNAAVRLSTVPAPGVSAYSASLDGRNIFCACQTNIAIENGPFIYRWFTYE